LTDAPIPFSIFHAILRSVVWPPLRRAGRRPHGHGLYDVRRHAVPEIRGDDVMRDEAAAGERPPRTHERCQDLQNKRKSGYGWHDLPVSQRAGGGTITAGGGVTPGRGATGQKVTAGAAALASLQSQHDIPGAVHEHLVP
jgi:hypothetical protein